MQTRFTTDNTDGYSEQQLDELNDSFEQQVYRELGDAPDLSENPAKSTADHIAERILAEFDARCFAPHNGKERL